MCEEFEKKAIIQKTVDATTFDDVPDLEWLNWN
jgi:hypothetical protein